MSPTPEGTDDDDANCRLPMPTNGQQQKGSKSKSPLADTDREQKRQMNKSKGPNELETGDGFWRGNEGEPGMPSMASIYGRWPFWAHNSVAVLLLFLRLFLLVSSVVGNKHISCFLCRATFLDAINCGTKGEQVIVLLGEFPCNGRIVR
jgi:hypothetical protein